MIPYIMTMKPEWQGKDSVFNNGVGKTGQLYAK